MVVDIRNMSKGKFLLHDIEGDKKKVKRAIIQEYKDIMSENEEAQANHVIKSRNSHAEVQPEDTDVFYLLLHFYYTQDWITEL